MRNYLYIIFVILLYSNVYKTIYYCNNSINNLELWLKEIEMKIMNENNFLIKNEEKNNNIKEIEVYFDGDDIILKSDNDLTNEDAQNIFNYLLENEFIEYTF